MTQKEALEILKTGRSVYLTGSAGSGKTHLLNQYIGYLKEHGVEVAVTASTGIAATHMGGVTIHSWSGLGVKSELSDYDLDALTQKQYLYRRFEKTKVLIIDEISMLHHFRLDLVDRILREAKHTGAPFGGIQVIFCGDLFQLPPVSRVGEIEGKFAYHSNAWKELGPTVCYLEGQFRQKDDRILEVLSAIRENRVTTDVHEVLETRRGQKPTNTTTPTRLYTHNIDVDMVNQRELEKIPGETRTFEMNTKGHDVLVDILKKSCLAHPVLALKKGARVMFVKNNMEMGYANGTLGTVVDFLPHAPIVEILSGEKIIAEPVEWRIEEEGKVKAGLTQVPLRLAWAITVHKSQGMSLDAIEVDLSKSFEPGMGYVALSRVRTLGGLSLLGCNDTALEVHPEVLEVDAVFQLASSDARDELLRMPKEKVREMQEDFLTRNGSGKKPKKKKKSTEEITKELIFEKKTFAEISKARGLKIDTIVDHIERLKKDHTDLDIAYLKKSHFTDAQFKKISEAFHKADKAALNGKGQFLLSPTKTLLGSAVSFLDLKIARLFLEKK